MRGSESRLHDTGRDRKATKTGTMRKDSNISLTNRQTCKMELDLLFKSAKMAYFPL